MLFAKILPAAQKIIQSTPFESTIVTADYMSALARPYSLGANKVNFEVIYCTITFDENQNPIKFDTVTSSNVILQNSQLQGGGSDDSFILQQLASSLSITIESYITVADNR
jgi:hypothetical protein